MKHLVIAGNNDQAMRWIKNDLAKRYSSNTSLSISDYTIIHRSEQLRGIRNPSGTFIGTWRTRTDLLDILMAIHVNSDPQNKTIVNLLTEVMK